MEKKSKKELHQLSEEQLQYVTGGAMDRVVICEESVGITPCPSRKFDNNCNCIE